MRNSRKVEQQKAYSVLRNAHRELIVQRLREVIHDDENLRSVLPFVSVVRNPVPKIVEYLSSVHSLPVVRTTGDDAMDEKVWRAMDVPGIAAAQRAAERIANACGDAFVRIFQHEGVVRAQALTPHIVEEYTEDPAGVCVEAVVAGERLARPEYVVRYPVDDSDPDWGISTTWPLVELALEVGVQLALFLETGYLRAHEQPAIDQLPPEMSPGDIGEIAIGTRRILSVPIRTVKLIDPETAQKFFQGLVDLTIFCAESYGIPKGYFLQTDVSGYPPALRDRWTRACARLAPRDRAVLERATELARELGHPLPQDVRWIVQYTEPRGMAGAKSDLERLEKEIALGINNPVWHAFATDGDFRTLAEAREWIAENLKVWGEIVEEKARRNIAMESSDRTPQENGAVRRSETLEPGYDGAQGPRVLPPESFAK